MNSMNNESLNISNNCDILCSVCDRDFIIITKCCKQSLCYKHEEEYVIEFQQYEKKEEFCELCFY